MLIFTSWVHALRWMQRKIYSKLLCMFSLNYQILDTSRANPLLSQKRRRKREKKKKKKTNSIRSCFNFWNVFRILFYVKSYWETKVQRWTLFANGCWSDVIWMNEVTLDVSQKLSSLSIVFCKPENPCFYNAFWEHNFSCGFWNQHPMRVTNRLNFLHVFC